MLKSLNETTPGTNFDVGQLRVTYKALVEGNSKVEDGYEIVHSLLNYTRGFVGCKLFSAEMVSQMFQYPSQRGFLPQAVRLAVI